MIAIELASEKDIPGVKNIADIKANKRYLGFTNRATLGASILKQELHVARTDNKVIGFIRWHRRRDGWTTVYELCVDESYRKQGIGQQLMRVAGTGPVKLKCHSDNPAIYFYKRLGFKIMSTEITKGGKHLDFLTREKGDHAMSQNADQKSELEQLLEKNSYGSGLTSQEQSHALQLIANPTLSEDDCWVCKMSRPSDIKKAILDTGLCAGHAYYALTTRK